MNGPRTWTRIAVAVMLAAVVAGCQQSELTENTAPVELVATNTQDIHQVDLTGDPSTCNRPIGSIELQAIPKSGTVAGSFVDVRVTRYRVSYVRTDGGRQVPATFTRSMDSLVISGGGSTAVDSFLVLEPGALNQAPFVALLPNNGGRDPDTGSRYVRMDVIIELFGSTLAGDPVSARTRMSLDFCYDCGGCQPS